MDDEADRRARLRDRIERESAIREQAAPVPGRRTLVEHEGANAAPVMPGVPGKTTLVAQRYGAVDVQGVMAEAQAALAGRGNHEHAYERLLNALVVHGDAIGSDEAGQMMSLCIDLATRKTTGKHESPAPVQRKSTGGEVAADPAGIAARGVASAGAPMPHLDRIQASFGRHDVSHVRTQTGGAAADASHALGASAYATGDRVGFASTPDLHTAAHEAAHVVQQSGGVQLKGVIDGGKSDPLEQHADTVADAVVRGESAQALLDPVAGHGGGAAAVQRKGAGSSLQPPTGDYCNTNRIHIVAAIADRIRAVGLPKPHPTLYWLDRAKAEQAIIDAIRKDIEIVKDRTLHRLMEHSYPADLYAIVDGVRQAGLPQEQAEWHDVVGIAIANAMSEPLDASIQRMALRLRVQLDGPAHGIPANAHLVPSCPLDVLVAEALTAPGVIGGGERKGSVDDTPGKPFVHGAEPVTFRLLGERDKKLWNWIEVSSPKHATAEDVASTELIPGKSDSVMGSAQSYRIAASPPYFGIPIEVARQVRAMRDLASVQDERNADAGSFGRVADVAALRNSDVSSDAAIAQAAPPEPHTPGLERLLGRVEVQLDAIETLLARVKSASMIAGAKGFVSHCRDELSKDPKKANRFVPAVAGQEGILHAVSSELFELFGELDKHRAKSKVTNQPMPAAVSELINAYASAAGASHLAAEANPLLADARRKKALLPLSLVDDEVRNAREAVAAQGGLDERGAEENLRSLPKAMTDAADARLRLTRGEAVSDTDVSHVNSDALELTTRARLTTLAGTVRSLQQQANEAKVADGRMPGGSWSVQKIVDMILDLIYGEEKAHTQFEGADKLHGGWVKRLDLAKRKAAEPDVKDPNGMWMQPAVNYVNGELALMDSQLGTMKEFIKWCNEQIAYARLKELLKSMAWQIGLMIVTGEIAGAGLAAIRGIALAGEIAEDVRGASLLWKGAEVLVHSGLQTVASGATGGEISGKAFAENALGMLLTSAAMKPFKSLLAGDAALEQAVEKDLSTLGKIGKGAKAVARVGAEAAIDVSAGVIGSGVAHAVVNNTEMGIAGRDEWMTQGFALAASAFVSAHTQGMHSRITVAAQEFRTAKMNEAAERLDALAARAEKLQARALSNKHPSPDEAGAMLVERHEILDGEHTIYQEFGGNKGASKKNAADLGATGSSFVEVPFQLAGLSPVVDGLSYEGTGKQIQKALEGAANTGIDSVATRDEKGMWKVKLGDRTVTIKELDFNPGAKSKSQGKATIRDGVGVESRAAEAVPDSNFTGTPEPGQTRAPFAKADVYTAAFAAVTILNGTKGGDFMMMPDGRAVLMLVGREHARIDIDVDNIGSAVAIHTYERGKNRAHIIVSEGARHEDLVRAMAHELSEIRALAADPKKKTTDPAAMTKGSHAEDLSHHDIGRKGELQVLLYELDNAPARREDVLHEIRALVSHLGLDLSTIGKDARARRLLGNDTVKALAELTSRKRVVLDASNKEIVKASARVKGSQWVFTIDVILPNGEQEHIGDGHVPLDAHGKPERGPDFYIDKRITYEGEAARIDFIKDGKSLPLTEYAITEASSWFKKEFGYEPTELPGSIADDNRAIFQRAYLAAIDSGMRPGEAADAAARRTPFVKNRVRLGFTDVRIVPTTQIDKIVYGNPPRVREVPHGAEIVAKKP